MTESTRPRITFITRTDPVAAGDPQILDVLVRVESPAHSSDRHRRNPVNLALVVDRSGSMSGHRLERAKEAACAVVDQLAPDDRIAVVAFDERILPLVPSMEARDREAIKREISRLESGGSTALFDGWRCGVNEVLESVRPGTVSRVLLLTDGQANVGECDPRVISRYVLDALQHGVSTSTVGIGAGFNEELLVPMAEAGGGTAWHVDDPSSIPAVLRGEFDAILGEYGHHVSLGIEPAEGVRVAEVLNDLQTTSYGRLMLPNLQLGQTIDVVVRLRVPETTAGASRRLFDARLAWDPVGRDAAERTVERAAFERRFARAAEAARCEPNVAFVKAVAFLHAAKVRTRAIVALDRGDALGAERMLAEALADLRRAVAGLEEDPEVRQEISALERLTREIRDRRNDPLTRKRMRYESHGRHRSHKPW